MSQRAVFLDRDDTIIECEGYLGDPAKVKLLPGAATALASLRALGYRLIVVSNQSGVARGMFTESDVEAVNDEMSRQLKEKAGAYIDASYYCPYHPEAVIAEYRVDHEWRKPKPGMLLQGAADFSLDLSQCWMVGDALRDIAAGQAVGCRTILLRDGDRKAPAVPDNVPAVPNFTVKSLADAARIIVREGRTHPAVSTPPEPARTPVVPPVQPAKVPPLASDTLVQTINHVSPRLEKSLEDLVILLRNQSRNADLRPDFSYVNMGAILFQVMALIAFVIGILKYFTLKVSFANYADIESAVQGHLGSILWVAVGIFFQGIVISLILYSRDRE